MSSVDEILEKINEIMPLGKLASGVVSTYLIIPIQPAFSFQERLIIGCVLGLPFFVINYLFLNTLLKLSSDKLFNLVGLAEAFIIVVIVFTYRW